MTEYQVFVTPLKSSGVYADEIDVSERVDAANVGEITRGIDASDFTVGIYAYDDVELSFLANDGYLNAPSDSRSVFKYQRDKAKVRIVFLKDGVPTSSFRGLWNEAGTVTNVPEGTITAVITSYDAILRDSVVSVGAVSDGMSFKNAIIAILNSISAGLLSIDATKINPVYNGTVDIGKAFDGKTAKEALNMILVPANSVLRVDSLQYVHVGSRVESSNPVLNLHGPGDLLGRENCKLLSFNTGHHRMFNQVRVTGASAEADVSGTTVKTPEQTAMATDPVAGEFFGIRVLEQTISFVTQLSTLQAIANAFLAEFRYPKAEIEVELPTALLQAQTPATDLLDRVSLNYPLLYRPVPGTKLPFFDISKFDEVYFPYAEGPIKIEPEVAWKVIEIRENPGAYTSILKCRVKGTETNDGYF